MTAGSGVAPLTAAPLAVANAIAAEFAACPGVEAVALGGSAASGGAGDALSDIDLYVYGPAPPPIAFRRRLSEERTEPGSPEPHDIEIDNRFFEPGDEWLDRSGIAVDIMYRTPEWTLDRLAAVIDRHEPQLGYTTSLWHNVRHGLALFDRDGWLERLQARAAAPYPPALRAAVIARNLPLLARARGSFANQIDKAARRGDAVAVNHRTAAFLASAFDILFALGRRLHPGEKRLLEHLRREGLAVPPGFDGDLALLLDGPLPQRAEAAGRIAAGIEAMCEEGRPATQPSS